MACGSPWRSRTGLLILSIVHLVLNFLSVVLYAPLGAPTYYGVIWFLFGLSSLFTFLMGIAFLVCVAIRKGKWLFRWMGLFMLWTWPFYLTAFILTCMDIGSSYKKDIFAVSIPFQGIFLLYEIYFIIGLLVRRHTLPDRVCENTSKPRDENSHDEESHNVNSQEDGAGYQRLQHDDFKTSCSREVGCGCCCSVTSGCRVALLVCLFVVAYIAVGFMAYGVAHRSIE